SRSAFRRAVQHGNGWYGFAMTVEETEQAVASLREMVRRYERPVELGELEISVTPRPTRQGLDRENAEQFAAAGVQRLIPLAPRSVEPAEIDRFLDSHAKLGADL
ncbi:MAG TPA: hypothetical protein VFO84_10300, partial [Dehalococcoidia bacterium]|nr:hypothetical protein [Dehalococcoidia bacterium]